jgi:hypothetical protein
MQLSKAPKPKATRKRKKEILSDDFKKRKIFCKNIAENFPYWKIFHLTTNFPSNGRMVGKRLVGNNVEEFVVA